jgi:hypothetical protein
VVVGAAVVVLVVVVVVVGAAVVVLVVVVVVVAFHIAERIRFPPQVIMSPIVNVPISDPLQFTLYPPNANPDLVGAGPGIVYVGVEKVVFAGQPVPPLQRYVTVLGATVVVVVVVVVVVGAGVVVVVLVVVVGATVVVVVVGPGTPAAARNTPIPLGLRNNGLTVLLFLTIKQI